MGHHRHGLVVVAALLAVPALAGQGPPVYTSIPSYPVAGGACTGNRVQIQANTGKPWCCVSSQWQACSGLPSAVPVPESQGGTAATSLGAGTVTATGSATARQLKDRFVASGAEQYVSPSGDDSFDGWTWGTAKKTILAAYDALPAGGGTIYIADQSRVGGSVANQGLWFIGTNDPLYATPPAGWRVEKAVHFIGVSGQTAIQFSRPATATILPGTSGSWVYDKPAIHLAGSFAAMTYENIAVISHPGTAVVLGLTTNYRAVRAISMVATKWFLNCDFSLTPGTGADDGLIGPTVDIGYAFWVYFDDSVIHANYYAPLGDDRHAAVRVTDSGLQYFRRGRWVAGGIISYMPGLVVEDILVESYGPALPPVVWLKNTANSSGEAYAIITNAARADAAAGIYPDVQIDGGSSGGATGGYAVLGARTASRIVVNGACTVIGGPATLIGGARPYNTWTAGQATVHPRNPKSQTSGLFQGRIFGRLSSWGRDFGPVAVRWPNLASEASWVSGGGRTVTRVTGPDGVPQSAYRFSSVGVDALTAYSNRTVALGDKVVIAAWIRLPSGGRAEGAGDNNGTLAGGDATTANEFNGIGHSLSAQPGLEGDPGDGNWMWMYAAGVYTAVPTPTTVLDLSIAIYDPAYPVEFYQPVLLHIPASEISDNEFGDLLDSLATYSSHALAGQRAMRGDLFLEDGKLVMYSGTAQVSRSAAPAAPTTGTWKVGDHVANSAPAVGQPKGWFCTVAGTPGTWVSEGNL